MQFDLLGKSCIPLAVATASEQKRGKLLIYRPLDGFRTKICVDQRYFMRPKNQTVHVASSLDKGETFSFRRYRYITAKCRHGAMRQPQGKRFLNWNQRVHAVKVLLMYGRECLSLDNPPSR
jgi:hypothetical protein